MDQYWGKLQAYQAIVPTLSTNNRLSNPSKESNQIQVQGNFPNKHQNNLKVT